MKSLNFRIDVDLNIKTLSQPSIQPKIATLAYLNDCIPSNFFYQRFHFNKKKKELFTSSYSVIISIIAMIHKIDTP